MSRIPRYKNYSFSIDQMLTLFGFHFKCLQNTVILSILNTQDLLITDDELYFDYDDYYALKLSISLCSSVIQYTSLSQFIITYFDIRLQILLLSRYDSIPIGMLGGL